MEIDSIPTGQEEHNKTFSKDVDFNDAVDDQELYN